MVRISQRRQSRSAYSGLRRLAMWTLGTVIFVTMSMIILNVPQAKNLENKASEEFKALRAAADRDVGGVAVPEKRVTFVDTKDIGCPYQSLRDLSPAERFPIATKDRHMVTPPSDTKDLGVTLVCCKTTAGPWSILAHHSWAPIGARRFLDMVESEYFNLKVPLMRCVRNFLCQFGLNGNPTAMKPFKKSLLDDPNWLPEGPDNRENADRVKRFQRGYMAYAGAGPNSRSLQLIIALKDNGPLAGGSPWEVPWGEIVGEHSFTTLSKIYTGYGEKGPKQSVLSRADSLKAVQMDFPNIDYVNSCVVVDREGGQGTS